MVQYCPQRLRSHITTRAAGNTKRNSVAGLIRSNYIESKVRVAILVQLQTERQAQEHSCVHVRAHNTTPQRIHTVSTNPREHTLKV